jgi:hypothetical protein
MVRDYKEETVYIFFTILTCFVLSVAGSGTMIAEEGAEIYQVVKDKIDESRSEFSHLEEAVVEQMSGKPKKKKKKTANRASSSGVNMGMVGGVAVNLGELPTNYNMDNISDSDSGDDDDSFEMDL